MYQNQSREATIKGTVEDLNHILKYHKDDVNLMLANGRIY